MDARLALYQFLDGRKLTAAEIGEKEVLAAAEFVAAINARDVPSAKALPDATEACFSIRDQFDVVDRRLMRLGTIPSSTEVDREARHLFDQLSTYWSQTREQITADAKRLGIALDDEVSPDERLISPADFGFHNALVRPDGTIAFIDFEHAGWDDLAKLVSDFFFQPAIPVDPRFRNCFVGPLASRVADWDATERRIALLRPIFGLKWCFIMLNRFLPAMGDRFRFTDPDADVTERKRAQLAKARRALDELMNSRQR